MVIHWSTLSVMVICHCLSLQMVGIERDLIIMIGRVVRKAPHKQFAFDKVDFKKKFTLIIYITLQNVMNWSKLPNQAKQHFLLNILKLFTQNNDPECQQVSVAVELFPLWNITTACTNLNLSKCFRLHSRPFFLSSTTCYKSKQHN